MNDITYLYGYSPNTGNHLAMLIPIIKSQIARSTKIQMVLIHDGVIGAFSKGKIPEKMADLLNTGADFYVMIPDLKARGIALENIDSKIKPIEYNNLIDLLDSTNKLISWM